MFGEDLSESPRVPSPWENLVHTPPSSSPPSITASMAIPRLVPEAEEGNIEYKLQLLHPSEARFTRLVTQMKWRLLEGGGQCYYEIGVADDGALVGLPRVDLEASLETLEMMAGEIGASVIVVKEVEIPAIMAGIAGSRTDSWNGKRQVRRDALMRASASPSEGESTTTEGSTTETDVTDIEDEPRRTRSSSDLFSMDSEVEDAPFAVDLEIASVFKPRPMRKRILHPVHACHSYRDLESSKPPKRRGPGKNRQRHVPRIEHDVIQVTFVEQTKGEAKAEQKKATRDRKREEKRKALLSYAELRPASTAGDEALADEEEGDDDEGVVSKAVVPTADVKGLLSGLEALHVPVDEHPVPRAPAAHPLSGVTYFESAYDVEVDVNEPDIEINNFTAVTPGLKTGFTIGVSEVLSPASAAAVDGGPRLIVEALVVRKMSMEEAFLDFGGFSLM